MPDGPDRSLPLIAAVASVLALAAALASFAERDEAGASAAICSGCLLAGLSLGLSDARAAYHAPLRAWFDSRQPDARDAPALLEGVLRDDGALTPVGATITIDVTRADRLPTRGGARLSVGGAAASTRVAEWRAGRAVHLHALVRVPTSFRNPGLPDEERALARRAVVLVGSVKSAALVEVVSRGSALNEAAASARVWARARLARFVGRWSARSGAIASAILIGDRSGLSDEDERRLQEAGTYHVIAISGGNIVILTALLMAALRVGRVPPRAAAGVSIVLLIFYGAIAGGGASVSRAITAAVVYLGGRMLDHRGPALNALAIAAVAALAFSPLAAADAGFLLSFGATLGILIGAQHLAVGRQARRRPGLVRRVAIGAAGLLAATVCAEIALAPIGAALFSRITFAGLLLNFAAIPLMTVAQAASIGTLLCAPFSAAIAAGCGYLAHVAAAGILRSAQLVEVAPWLSRDVPAPSWGLLVAYYACAALLLFPRYRRLALGGIALSFAIMIAGPAAGRGAAQPPSRGHLRVVFFDVGQGDATLVWTAEGHAMLVDAGGLAGSTFDIGERVLAPSIRALGVRSLDALVLTHGDPDHIGGAATAIRRFTPRSVWEGTPVPAHAGLRELAALAVTRHAIWRTVQAGDSERSGDATIRVLHPPPPDWERQRVRNDDSVVLELRLGGVSILLPGDIGSEPERTLAPRLALAPTVIVKAPHHGSATSSTQAFIDAVHPAAVIFSAGRGNRFGHPAPAVVARYRAAGAITFGTDEDGAVVVETDGKRVEISTWSGRRISIAR